VMSAININNVWTNILDNHTGESVNFEEVTTWVDGTPMDDSKVDGVIYRKLPASVGGGYVKRVYTGPIKSQWINLDNTGNTDVSSLINQYIAIDDLELDNGVYLGNPTVSNNKLIGKTNTTILSSPSAADSSVITVINGGKLESINADGNGAAARGIVVGDTSGNFEIKQVTISNLLGVEAQSVGILVSAALNHKIVHIQGCEITDITGGSAEGAGSISRGILITGNCTAKIEDCIFREVGTFEDGDCIAIQTTQNIDTGQGWSETNVIING